jgi:predicted membrane protein
VVVMWQIIDTSKKSMVNHKIFLDALMRTVLRNSAAGLRSIPMSRRLHRRRRNQDRFRIFVVPDQNPLRTLALQLHLCCCSSTMLSRASRWRKLTIGGRGTVVGLDVSWNVKTSLCDIVGLRPRRIGLASHPR